MSTDRGNNALEGRLQEMARQSDGRLRVEDLRAVADALLETLDRDAASREEKARAELEGLVSYIDTAKREIAALSPADIPSEFIPTATDELDAIVKATETATNDILDATERIEAVSAQAPPEMAEALNGVVTKIYEASNFQDVTGQRVNKVVRVLRHIEERIHGLVDSLGLEAPAAGEGKDKGKPALKDEREDSHLLEGPQMEGGGRNQDEIDALLASFD